MQTQALEHTSSEEIDVSLVIPAYNEEERLPASLKQVQGFLSRRQFRSEVVVVVEPGTDDTLSVANRAGGNDAKIRVLAPPVHRGKGAAVREGILAARGKLRFFMDADLSTELEAIDRFVQRFEQEPRVDVLIGSRQHPESKVEVFQGGLRRWMGQTFNRVVQATAFRGIQDTQCGFKAFRARAAEMIFSRQQIEGFAFDVEVLMLAQRLGYRIEEMPVIWKNSVASKVRVVKDSLAMFRDVMMARRLVDEQFRTGSVTGSQKVSDYS